MSRLHGTWLLHDALMQTCKKGAHFSQHISLVRNKDRVIRVGQANHVRRRDSTFKRIHLCFCGCHVSSQKGGGNRIICIKSRTKIVRNRENRKDREMEIRVLLFTGDDRLTDFRGTAICPYVSLGG